VFDFDSLVIGAGVVGLACARSLALTGRSVLALEAEARIGEHASSRNSEVIHAGIYYPPGSRKAALCVAGNRLLTAYCEQRGVPFRRLGKLVVATTPEELGQLESVATRAEQCGVDLQPRTSAEVRALEPEIVCQEALWSPTSGIVDSHALMLALLGDFEQAGGTLVLRSPFVRAERESEGWSVVVGGSQPTRLTVREIVNCAGLHAPSVAAQIGGVDPDELPRERYCRGHYFSLRGRNPFRHLVYPVPVRHGLGVHVTLDLAGQARFGPDVSEWPTTVDYRFEDGRKPGFIAAVRRYFPGLRDDQLEPSYTGLRSKISGPDEPSADFRIDGPAEHGVTGLVNLMGIESPGLTASLAIAQNVVGILPRLA